MEDLISINEEGLDKVALDIYDYAEKINKIFLQIDDLMCQSLEVFKCSTSNDIVEKYKGLKESMKNINFNIQSYSTDLLKVKNIFRNNASDISNVIRKEAENIQSIDA